jgi:hypothetical protein
MGSQDCETASDGHIRFHCLRIGGGGCMQSIAGHALPPEEGPDMQRQSMALTF